MNSQILFTIVLAAVMTPVTSLLKREHWPDQVKYLIAVGISVIAAVIEVVAQNKPTSWTAFAALAGVAIATSQTIYRMFFAGSDFEDWIINATKGSTTTTATDTVVTTPVLEPATPTAPPTARRRR